MAEWLYPLKFGDTLSGHDWMPFYIDKFLRSSFVSHALAEGRRADIATAVLLWSDSFKHDPAGTLPDDDVELARSAGFGADIAAWRAIRDGALYGWEPIDIENAEPRDKPRLGHPFIAEIVVDMHKRKRGREQSRAAGRKATMRSRVRTKLRAMGNARIASADHVVMAIADWLDANDLYLTDDNLRAAMEVVTGVPKVVGGIGSGKV
ncbi:DUF1376 domain-containing protein [Thioclava sp. BHET1]|nr:DUF1376 domain-containing protein [Thioclava sp. BHET1]